MDVEEEAVLFDLPTSPMLSILQLRHANLSDYSHAPSYILGNSYATPRYLDIKPGEGYTQSPGNQRVYYLILQITGLLVNISSEHIKQASPGNGLLQTETYIPRNRANYGSVRDVNAQNEHQNTTLDHSYYANRALLDDMSGVGHDQWQPKSLSQMQAEKNSIEMRKLTAHTETLV